MRVLRSRVIPSVADETPTKKPKRSPEIDPSTPAGDEAEVVGTPPSHSSVPTPDSGGPRSAASLLHPRRSLHLASAASGIRGAAEGLPPPQECSPCKGEGSGEGASTCEGEKVEALKQGRRGGMSNRQNKGKRKLEVDASLIGADGLMSLRSGKSIAKRAVHSGVEHDVAENLADVIEVEGNQGVMWSQGSGVAADGTENRENGSRAGEIVSLRSRKNLRHKGKGKDKISENEVIDLVSEGTGGEPGGIDGQRKYVAEEKGKAKMIDLNDMLSVGIDAIDLDLGLKHLRQGLESFGRELLNMVQTRSKSSREKAAGESSSVDIRGRFRDIARRNASRFAHFSLDDESGNNLSVEAARNVNAVPRPADPEPEDWPGPFSTAMKIIRDRGAKMSTPHSNSSLNKCKSAITWVPNRDRHTQAKRLIPSLLELCLSVLAANADAITSLDGVPDVPRHKLSQLLCDSRKMNKHFFDLLFGGSPTEIRIKDSSWLTEEELTESLRRCDTRNLVVYCFYQLILQSHV